MKYNLTESFRYQLYAYDCPALDWTFCFFTVNEFQQRIRNLDKQHVLPDREALVTEINELLEKAEEKAKEAGWDGIYRDEPLIFVLPAGSEYNVIELEPVTIPDEEYTPTAGTVLFGIIIKQDNDGITFIYSPVKLENLSKEYSIF